MLLQILGDVRAGQKAESFRTSCKTWKAESESLVEAGAVRIPDQILRVHTSQLQCPKLELFDNRHELFAGLLHCTLTHVVACHAALQRIAGKQQLDAFVAFLLQRIAAVV